MTETLVILKRKLFSLFHRIYFVLCGFSNVFFQVHCPFCQFVSTDTIDSLRVIYVDLRRDNSNKL